MKKDMKNRISASLVIAALFGVGAENVLAGPTLLALRSESGATQTVETNFGTSQASLAFPGTTTYDFYSPPLLVPTSLEDKDKGGGTIFMKNTGTAPANDFKVTGQIRYLDYDPATGTETLIVATGISPHQDVHHGHTEHWPLPNGDLHASHTVPAGHLLHIAVGITLVGGNPGSFGQLLYNGTSASTTVGQLPQNNHPTVWAFGNPVTPSLCLSRQPDGCARLTCAGLPGQTYRIQATTSLAAPQWTTIATNTTGLDGLFSFIDVNAPDYPCRFYRTSNPKP
jgi:hypothetical protein